MDNDAYLNALSVMEEFMPNRQDPTREHLEREANLPIVVVCDTEHLAQVAERVKELTERAMKGDRTAQKELMFAERYGMKPPFLEFIDIDLNESEARIEQHYRDQGVKDGQFKNHGSTTGRRTFD